MPDPFLIVFALLAWLGGIWILSLAWDLFLG